MYSPEKNWGTYGVSYPGVKLQPAAVMPRTVGIGDSGGRNSPEDPKRKEVEAAIRTDLQTRCEGLQDLRAVLRG